MSLSLKLKCNLHFFFKMWSKITQVAQKIQSNINKGNLTVQSMKHGYRQEIWTKGFDKPKKKKIGHNINMYIFMIYNVHQNS